MKKALILTLVMLMVMSLSAFATSTRTLTLGENNNVLLDDNNIWMYPSRLFQYPNIATGEFAREAYGNSLDNNFYNFGVNWKFGEKKPWVLGTYFSTGSDQGPFLFNQDSPYGTSVPGFSYFNFTPDVLSSPSPTPQNGVSTDRRMDLLYSRKFGTYLFGFEFNFVHASSKSEVPSNSGAASYGNYGFTVGLTPEDGKWDVALNLATGSFKNVDSAGHEFLSADGYMDFNVYGRYFWKYNEMITLVPHAAVGFGTHGVKYDSTGLGFFDGSDQKTKRTFFELGSGMNYRPVNGVLGVLDFGIEYDKVKNDLKRPDTTLETSEFYFPYWKIGVEGEVFSWMTLRLGARSNWVNYKNIEPGNGFNKVSEKYAENNTYLGAGLNFNRLHIDTYMDPQIVLHGFDFITGNNNNDTAPNDLNFHVSVLYDMF